MIATLVLIVIFEPEISHDLKLKSIVTGDNDVNTRQVVSTPNYKLERVTSRYPALKKLTPFEKVG